MILLIIVTMAWSIVFAGLQSVCISDSANTNNDRPTILNMNVRNMYTVTCYLVCWCTLEFNGLLAIMHRWFIYGKEKKRLKFCCIHRWLHITFIRRVWRYQSQRDNQNLYIEEQTTHCHNGQYWIPGACNCSPGFQFDIKSW